MNSKAAGLISSVKFGLIIILFLMPFVNVSCTQMVKFSFTGVDMVQGKTIEIKEPFSGKVQRERINPEPHARLAFGCAIIGLLFGFAKFRPARLFNTLAGFCGAVMLLLLKNKVDNEVLKEGGGIIAVNYDFAYWAALILFLVAAVFNIYFFAMKNGKDS